MTDRQLAAERMNVAEAERIAHALRAENRKLKTLVRHLRQPPDSGMILTFGRWVPGALPAPRRGGWGRP